MTFITPEPEEDTAVDAPPGVPEDARPDVLTEIVIDTLSNGPNPSDALVPSIEAIQEILCPDCSKPVSTEIISSPEHFLCGECGASYHSVCVLGEPRVDDSAVICNPCLEAQRAVALAIAQEKFAILTARRNRVGGKKTKAEGRTTSRTNQGGRSHKKALPITG